MSTTPITIRFMQWECGHHGQRPADIPCQTIEQANLILQAISHAISQPGHARAAVFDDTHGQNVYITDDYVEPVGPLNNATYLTTLYIGTAEEMAELESPALTEALEWELGGMPPVWDGKDDLTHLEAVAVMTAERAEALTAPVEWHEEANRAANAYSVPPIIKPLADLLLALRAEAAAQAVETGDVEPANAGGAAC